MLTNALFKLSKLIRRKTFPFRSHHGTQLAWSETPRGCLERTAQTNVDHDYIHDSIDPNLMP